MYTIGVVNICVKKNTLYNLRTKNVAYGLDKISKDLVPRLLHPLILQFFLLLVV